MKISISSIGVGVGVGVDVDCDTIAEAEIVSAMCTDKVNVKIINSNNDKLFFTFNPNVQGFTDALTKTREKVANQREEFC